MPSKIIEEMQNAIFKAGMHELCSKEVDGECFCAARAALKIVRKIDRTSRK